MASKIKAVKYKGPFKVEVEEVDMPKLEHADDVLVKVTTACMPHIQVLYTSTSY